MAIYSFSPKRVVKHLDEGEYTGIIQKIWFCEDKEYFVFEIQTENKVFNTVFAVQNSVFNNFASGFVDEEGHFKDDDLIGKSVAFAVKDVAESPEPRSKITMITAI